MNLTKCHVLLKTAELGSITRAAEALGYTQSAVSRTIADLERDWGLELLTRSRSGVAITSQGELLLPYVRAVCNAGRQLEEQVAGLHGLACGTLRVGTFTSISVHWLPTIMKDFLSHYPGIQFDLVSGWEFAEIEDWIRKGQVDCGFIGLPAGPGLEAAFLKRDRLLALLPPEHPLAGADCYPIARFAQDPYIRLSEDRDVEIARIFQEQDVRPNVRYTVNDDYAIIAMVEQGLGVSIMSELVLRNQPCALLAKPLDVPRFRDIGLAVKNRRAASPLTLKFLECVRRWVGDTQS